VEAASAIDLWRESFPADWAPDALDLGAVRSLMRKLLRCRRLPLGALHVLGSAAELWVAYQDGQLVGVLGQLGEQIPRLTGLVLHGDVRGTGVAGAFLQRVVAEHDGMRTRLIRALPAYEGWGRGALARLGFAQLGGVQDYELALPLSVSLSSEERVRWLRWRQRRALVGRAMAAGDLARAVTVDGAYGAPVLSWLGLVDGLVVGPRGEPAGVEYSKYREWGQVRLCPPAERGHNVLLLRVVAEELSRRGVRSLRVALWDSDMETRRTVERWGARVGGHWSWMARRRGEA